MPNRAGSFGQAKLLPIAAALAIFSIVSLPAQDLPQWVMQLSRIKRQAKAELLRLPNFTCLETINRFHAQSGSEVFKPLDIVRVDVAFVDGKEVVAPVHGAAAFQEMDLHSVLHGGLIGTGAFSAISRNLFVNDNARTTGWAEEKLQDRPALRYNFVIPERVAGYTLTSRSASAKVGLEGSFWVDAASLELLRIDEHVIDVPATLDIRDSSTSVTYARTRIGASDVLLPRTAESAITEIGGWRGKNLIEFSACREYVAESVISFDSSDGPPPAKKK
jgi:hypothetical protein